MARPNRPSPGRRSSQSGAVAVEFAIIGPVFMILMFGAMAWGNYFWLSHAVQQVANDAARAALGGLDTAERRSMANATLAAEIDDYAYLKLEAASVTIQDNVDRMTVTVIYDASDSPFWAFDALVPMPSKLIKRQASVRMGGY
jgi:Flp pilus assembly protein TadG